MPHPARLVTLLVLLAPLPASAQTGVQVTQMTVRGRIVIRVPMVPPPPAPARASAARMAAAARLAPPRPVTWRERNGPRCIGAQTMAGALVSAPNQVDLVLLGGRRVRARLDGDCKPLDFYSGFYLRPSADGMICADRDAIRVRSGAQCRIDRFRLLQPVK